MSFLNGRPAVGTPPRLRVLAILLLLTLALSPAVGVWVLGAGATIHVDDNTCPAVGSGTLADPYCSIRSAICVAVAGDTVSVGNGTYNIAVRMKPGVSLVSKNGPLVTTINATNQPCTLGDYCGVQTTPLQCAAVTIPDNHTPSTVLDGFTIRGGAGRILVGAVGGGGIYVFSSPTIRNNIITANVLSGPLPEGSALRGAGIYVAFGSPVITNNTISNNVALPPPGTVDPNGVVLSSKGYGGGMWIGFFSSPVVTDNIIQNNVAGDPNIANSVGAGGGVVVFPGSGPTGPLIDRNVIADNDADTTGGGISVMSEPGNTAVAKITNNVIVGNAGRSGGGIYTYFSSADIINNTIVANDALRGAGIYHGETSIHRPVRIINNIIRGNIHRMFGDGGGIYWVVDQDPNVVPSISYNVISGNQLNQCEGDITDANCAGVNGNLNVDPLFEDPNARDYHIEPPSPAIDAANVAAAPTLDHDVRLRGYNGAGAVNSPQTGDVDIGAFEYSLCSPATEVCDGLDNDCDSTIDDGFNIGTPCDGVGGCGAGLLECNGSGGVRCSTDPGGTQSQVTSEVCNGVDDDCDGVIDDGLNLGAACEGIGPCGAGVRECGVGGAVRCSTEAGGSASQAVAETCNGIDDDCNGVSDNGFNTGAVCDGVGACGTGTRECSSLTTTRCSTDPGGSQTQVVAETCDGLDNDCDATTDEGFNLGQACDGVGQCGAGVRECNASGGTRCSTDPGGSQTQVVAETCDGLDNDCDATTDEGFNLGQACDGVGQCGTGVRECNASGGTRCSTDAGGSASQSAAETCDGLDNDCNAVIDNGFNIGAVCDGVGACGAGVRECSGAATTRCSTDAGGSASQAVAELCDALDNDCDGTTDEGFSLGSACDGIGLCGAGIRECNATGGTRCSTDAGGSASQAVAELCDALDNDCDGVNDDGFNLGSACDGVGLCGAGIRQCNGAGGARCSTDPGGTASQVLPETCNGLDDDCDGVNDDGFSLGVACDGVGACGAGVRECTLAGGVGCSTDSGGSQSQAVTETCDGLDNDCDGVADELFSVGQACDGVGACGAGVRECSGLNAARCSTDAGGSASQAVAETCDGVDNDCDGAADDGFSLGQTCDGVGACGIGVRECGGPSATRCSTDPGGSAGQAGIEICDSLDNDCDGTSDEGFNLGQACDGVGACGAGTRECSAIGGTRCSTDAGGSASQAAPEICDALDNDCDGLTNEGFVVGQSCDGVGACGAGVFECTLAGGLGCSTDPGGSQGQAVVEICDGLDNDCDGPIDELFNVGQTCDGVGACGLGVFQCKGPNATGCSTDPGGSQSQAVTETCDGLDNDCDGIVDDTFNVGTPCDGIGQCGIGVFECAGPSTTRCSTDAGSSASQAIPEICDSLDNDCDGLFDDGFSLGAACEGAGECGAGVTECGGPSSTRCNTDFGGSASQSVPEVCDSLDNDCDSVVDDGFADTDHDGLPDCADPDDDNDLDPDAADCAPLNGGSFDDPFEVVGVGVINGPTRVSFTPQNIGSGTRYDIISGLAKRLIPAAMLQESLCAATNVASTPWTDTRPNPPIGDAWFYLVRSVNACGLGTLGTPQRDTSLAFTVCQGGIIDADGDGSPSSLDCDDTDPVRSPINPEICDNIDNDCNSLPDDGIATGNSCDGVGACGAGVMECREGAFQCSTNPGGSASEVQPETCNGLDDDCDSVPDDGLGLGQTCDGVGICGAGLRECNGSGGTRCSTDPGGSASQAGVESCDALDNDCDGAADEGFNVGQTCDGIGACGAGMFECNGTGGSRCSTDAGGSMSQATAETCDSLDNDCDGITDDGLNIGQACDGVGACGAGVRECNGSGGTRCSTDAGGTASQAVSEVCDSLDNDCDGTTDEFVKNACNTCGALPADNTCNSVDDNCNGVVDEGCCTSVSATNSAHVTAARAHITNVSCGTTTVLTDNFEGTSPTGWTLVGTPVTSTTTPIAGTRSLQLQGSDEVYRDINTLGLTGVTISYQRNSSSQEAGDIFVMRYSTNAGASWTNLESVDGAFGLTSRSFSLPLANPLRISFRNNGNSTTGDNVYIDTLVVSYPCVTTNHFANVSNDPMGTNPSTVFILRNQPIGSATWRVGACATCQATDLTCNSVDDDCNGTVDDGLAERCDGVDNDCDTQIDEGFGTGVSCDGIGQCGIGVIQCAAPDQTRCSTNPGGTQNQAVAETCNALDDDCDGTIDDGYFTGQGCDGVGACGIGVIECSGPSTTRCSTNPGGSGSQVATEICDALDNDCDGATDEGFGTISCGVGACQVTGNACLGGVPQVCVPGMPSAEVCDAVDNDCDGSTDEGFSVGGSCDGVGACGIGVFECDGSGGLRCSTDEGGSASQVATEICDALDNDCDGTVNEGFNTGQTCEGVGTCGAGVRECATTTTTRCSTDPGGSASQATAETCDSLDNDCDGTADENFNLGQNCDGVGACGTGIFECNGSGGSRCSTDAGGSSSQVQPEICDTLDNDCDGTTNEGFSLGQTCDGVGACGTGIFECNGSGGARCSTDPGGSASQVATEICDALDNDCDGTVNDGFNVGQTCDGVGACGAGVFECANPSTTRCSTDPGGSASQVATEICDALDNDCDGTTNEGFNVGQTCDGVGACGAGVFECNGSGGARCSTDPGGSASQVATEICDALDNDCDGTVNDGFNTGQACDGVGACGAGVFECASTSTTRCSTDAGGSASQVATEICDALDNDCDGTTNEGFNVGQTCDGVGACGAGVFECASPSTTRCSTDAGGSASQVVTEICDALDNDCDGTTNEGFNLGQTCDGAGVCGIGVRECASATTTRCSTEAGGSADQSSPEICDSLDNDCDGTTNESFNIGQACDGVGACGAGVNECASTTTARCSTDPGGSASQVATEICDALDNDCDGTTNEGFNAGQACDGVGACGAGVFECASASTTRCSTDAGGSASQVAQEMCDGLDNDCDGASDEIFSLGTACAGVGECGVGVIECGSDPFSIRCSTEPGGSADQSSPDICDYLDNDCDGSFDEDFTLGHLCSGIGECGPGVYECTPSGGMQCSTHPGGSASPAQPEVCDGLDNDCNGVRDNGFGTGEVCDGVGTCGSGVRECATTSTTRCSTDPGGSQSQVGTETCDALDNDCDGTTDEGFNLGLACEGAGVCGIGVLECNGSGGTLCSTEPGGSQNQAVAESCDSLDNDCDGVADDGLNLGQACDGVGACGAGVRECTAVGGTRCSTDPGGSASQGVPEVCDSLDNDCDGTTDELVTNACGGCGALPADNTCNSVDDNCNGVVDEGCCTSVSATNSAHVTAARAHITNESCGTTSVLTDNFENTTPTGWTLVGTPITSTTTPIAGTRSLQLQGSDEVHRDINTLGLTGVTISYQRNGSTQDAGDIFVMRYSTNGGANWTDLESVNGTFTLTSRSFALPLANPLRISFRNNANNTSSDAVLIDTLVVSYPCVTPTYYANVSNDLMGTNPSATTVLRNQPIGSATWRVGGTCTTCLATDLTCNSVDDDCNGTVDDGQSERCDGIDNDCDAQIDEGFNVGQACDGVGACGAGVRQCRGIEQSICSTDPGGTASQAVPEICDALDNDCDGTDNEGFFLGQTCDGVGACGIGVLECSSTAATRCSTDIGGSASQSVPEQCDALDNDCNGVTDDGSGDVDDDGLTDCLDPDDDNDGVLDAADCAPLDVSAFAIPTEVANLVVTGAGPTTLNWVQQNLGSGTIYVVGTGTITLSGEISYPSGICFGSGPEPPAMDGRPAPPIGRVYYYMVKSRNACGAGTFGSAARDTHPGCP